MKRDAKKDTRKPRRCIENLGKPKEQEGDTKETKGKKRKNNRRQFSEGLKPKQKQRNAQKAKALQLNSAL